jgi:hypothetical protein
MLHILTNKRLQALLKEAYERGLALGYASAQQAKRAEQEGLRTILQAKVGEQIADILGSSGF